MRLTMLLFALGIAIAIPVWGSGRAPVIPSVESGRFERVIGSAQTAPVARTTLGSESAAPDTVTTRTFPEYVAELTELAVATANALEDGDRDRALELDKKSRDLVARLRATIEGWDEAALFAFAELLAEDVSMHGVTRRRVLTTLVELGLRERWSEVASQGRRARCDALVSTILELIPDDETAGRQLGIGMLTDQPFLGVAHEPAVLGLVDLSIAQPWLEDIATALLRTLWHNLNASGTRSSAELAGLALLFLDDANPVRHDAALHHLLVADGGRHARLVVERVVGARDVELAAALAMTAARELPVDHAIAVIEELVGVGDAYRFMGAFLTLGERDADVLRRAYEQKLGDLVAPDLRAELVTGAGFGATGALDLAQSAFESDPNGDVRARALLVLSAEAEPAAAERWLLRALDDPTFADRTSRLSTIVSGVRNLARQPDCANAVDRLRARLETHPWLSDTDRRALQGIVAAHVPNRGG
ncbi:MAG: hypothetical protein KDB80_01325 [Planctomycetes bacterium]|nr:hypothetical protein [Planctomycetota bacterium]